MEFFLKNMDERHSAKVWQKAAELGLLKIAQTERGFNYLITALHYCLTGKEIDGFITIKQALQAVLSTEQGEELRGSAAQKLYNDGKHEGIVTRNHEIALNLLRAGSDITFISTVTGLSMLEIQKLKADL